MLPLRLQHLPLCPQHHPESEAANTPRTEGMVVVEEGLVGVVEEGLVVVVVVVVVVRSEGQ